MKCGIPECSGEYEERHIIHTVRHKRQIVVVNHVPAEICLVCGDTLLKPDTVQALETLLNSGKPPVGSVPLYEFQSH